MLSWKPTSTEKLEQAEAAMLSVVRAPYAVQDVDVGGGHVLHTVVAGQGPPLVLLHGFGGGAGLWSLQIDALAQHHTVYALDLPGFGLSSRPSTRAVRSPEQALAWFLDPIEAWADQLGLQQFHLLGHSFGGHLAGHMAARLPHRLLSLILADPWGVAEAPAEFQPSRSLRALHSVVTAGGPLGIVRALGPWGPNMLARARQDFVFRFREAYGNAGTATDYLYHLSAQPAAGEHVFTKLEKPIAAARLPLTAVLPGLPSHLRTLAVYGDRSWMDYRPMVAMRREMRGSVELYRVPFAGHHCYGDAWRQFNDVVSHHLRPDDGMARLVLPYRVPDDHVPPARLPFRGRRQRRKELRQLAEQADRSAVPSTPLLPAEASL